MSGSVTDLQNDPDGLTVAVKQGGGGRDRQLGQCGQTEQNGPIYQSPGDTHTHIGRPFNSTASTRIII